MEKHTAKMFEMMQKLNPDFKLNEDNFGTFNSQPAQVAPQPTQPTQAPQPEKQLKGDNKTYNKATQTNVSLANKSAKINTTNEFPDAFKTWFSKLGYSPDSGAINISRVLANVRKAMIELGYK